MHLDLDWNSIRPLNGTKHAAFEELCTQLARAETPAASRFVRKGTPDSGVECFTVHPDGTEWGWQSKYFQSMGASQWQQIDKSVKAALAGHPRLTRYTVCVSCDLPDGRAGKTSALDRWHEHVATWKELARKRRMAIEFIWAGSHEVLAQLAKPTNAALRDFFWSDRFLSEDWLRSRLKDAFHAAGPRYTQELHVKLALSERFHALGRTHEFHRRIQAHAIEIREALQGHIFGSARVRGPALDPFYEAAREACKVALDALVLLPDEPIVAAPLAGLHAALRQAIAQVDKLLAQARRQAEAASAAKVAAGEPAVDTDRDRPYGVPELRTKLVEAFHAVEADVDIVDRKLLLLTGDAGSGKTHLLCDLARQRLDAGLPTVVLMGQLFQDTADPWTQSLRLLDLQGWSVKEFVGALEVMARQAGRRAFVIVDALNEGLGARLWRTQLAPFLARLSESPWITTVLSIRNGFQEDVIAPEVEKAAFSLDHHGFDQVEFDATRAFFEHYGIDLPSTPLLAPEFRNPLYLKTLCKGLRDTGRRSLHGNFRGLVGAFKLYLEGANATLATALDYPPRQDLVSKALDRIARRMTEGAKSWLPYDEVQQITDALLPNRSYSNSLLAGLLREGLLVEERVWDSATGGLVPAIAIGYERLSDYLCVRTVLDDALASGDCDDAFRKGGPLDEATLQNRWPSPGFHEALHILVAERTGKELLKLVPGLNKLHHTASAFLASLVWRDPKAVTPDATKRLLALKDTRKTEVVETLVTLATIPGHPLNSRFTDDLLRKTGMTDRDAWWSVSLHDLWDRRGAVDRLVQWTDRLWPQVALDEDAAELTALAITWLLGCPNRFLRDRATKSLTRVLTWRPALAVQLVRRFVHVDDAYIAERVMAAVMGATTRTTDAAGAALVAGAVHAAVFAGGAPRPHVLLRDYARTTIKRAEHLLGAASPAWKNIDPPYKSAWPTIPSEAALEKVAPKWKQGGPEKGPWGPLRIRSSVMDDDFARYIIGTNFRRSNWLSVRLDEPTWMSLEHRIELATESFTKPQHSAWNNFKAVHDELGLAAALARFPPLPFPGKARAPIQPPAPALTAKILATARAQLLKAFDSEERTPVEKLLDEMDRTARDQRPTFDLSIIQRYVLGRVFELGWTPERFEDFDRYLETHGRSPHKAERIGKKYQWIALHEMLAFLADHYQYTGPSPMKAVGGAYQGSWQDKFRDIDPTSVTQPPLRDGDTGPGNEVFWATASIADWHRSTGARAWALMTSDIPLPETALFSRDAASGTYWVSVWADLKWSMPRAAHEDSYRSGRREMWMNVEGGFVRRSDAATLLSKAVAREVGQSSFDSNENYQIYLGEIGWSDAAHHFLDPYYGHSSWPAALKDKALDAAPASLGYLREHGTRDCSIQGDSQRMRVPAQKLIELLRAQWSGISATWVSGPDRMVVAFDPSANVAGPPVLLVRRETLAAAMDRNELALCWVIHGEKTEAHGAPDYGIKARRSFYGVFLWDGHKVSGAYSFDAVEVGRADNA